MFKKSLDLKEGKRMNNENGMQLISTGIFHSDNESVKYTRSIK